MVDLTQFKAGIEAAMNETVDHCSDPRGAFLDALHAAGYSLPKSVQVGRIDRIDSPDDKKGKKSGWYSYQEIETGEGQVIGVATFGSWKTGEKHTWSSRSTHKMSAAESLRYHQIREEMRANQDREQAEMHAKRAGDAFKTWSELPEAKNHEYYKKKGIKPVASVKVNNEGRLIVPMAINNQIHSLQYIRPDGSKRFMTGGKTKGAYFLIEGNKNNVYIAEGLATAASIFEATGSQVYICFTANNIYEVTAFAKASHDGSRIIIAGDDDTNTAGNPGRSKSEQAAQGLSVECVFPPGYNDFNDMHVAAGVSLLKKYLEPKEEAYEPPPEQKQSDDQRPPGILGAMYDYYNTTSGNKQLGFAVQTSLAIASTVLGRAYKTNYENYASLYLLNVGKSGTGKEHIKTVAEKILLESGLGYLIAGDGYTSAGAVFSALLDRPKHLSVIDEFGRYLEAGRDLGKGNTHQREANTKLMESIGRAHSVMRPPTYSTMTLKKKDADEMKARYVHSPAITLLTMTTPDTLFRTLDMGAIKDGFVNRFLISISDAERVVRKHMRPLPVPESIVSWVKHVTKRHGKIHISGEPAQPITLEFTQEADDLQIEFQEYCIEKANYLERFGMAELTGRSNEMAMRIALICALSSNPDATEISAEHMRWSIAYVKQLLERTIDKLKMTISHSDFEAQKKEILTDLRSRGAKGITWAKMQKSAPYSAHKPKDLKEIMQALKDAELAGDEPYQTGGRPTILWKAIK